jgi:hypothetical protein
MTEVMARLLQIQLVHVTPAPVFARFKRLDNRVLCAMEVFAGVAVPGRIAATHVAADQTLAQVNPSVAGFEAILATGAAGRDFADFGYVLTAVVVRHAFPRLDWAILLATGTLRLPG